MKLVSKKCTICQESIQFQAEGIWCDACKTPFHKKCLIEAKELCSVCEEKIIYPDDPLNLKTKKTFEGIKKYPKEYWLLVILPTIILTSSIIGLAWYFLPWGTFGLFLICFCIFAIICEAAGSSLFWKFDDWIINKFEEKRKTTANNNPVHRTVKNRRR